MIKPKKRLGQHFLVDKNIINKCIQMIGPEEDDILIEIGPGKGALTEKLIDAGVRLIAIEKDKNLYSFLMEKYSGKANVEIINEDALKLDFEKYSNQNRRIRVVGNIPYNITSPLIFKLIENRAYIKDVHLMIQKDVALRLIARPGTKEYGILSVILGLVADVKKLFDISNNCFYPIPKVMSSFIRINFKDLSFEENFFNDFKEIVKVCFNKRRKTLRNVLRDFMINEDQSPINLSQRAETLNIEQFVSLTKFLKN